jgi:phage-related holin
MDTILFTIKTVCGVICAAFTFVFGGLDALLLTLLCLIAVDYVSGVIKAIYL